MRKNLFIAFEGIDGSGKSTQVRNLTEALISEGHRVYSTFEPSGGEVGLLLRKILKGESKADERTIAALFVADRLDHLLNEQTGIIGKLEEGFTVITDRYYLSSYAYNGTHIEMNWVMEANSLCADIRRPDVNIFIDVEPETCMERLKANRDVIERYETLATLKDVRAKYFEAFNILADIENILVVNGNQVPERVFKEMWDNLGSMFS